MVFELAFNPVLLVTSFMVFCAYMYHLTVAHQQEQTRR